MKIGFLLSPNDIWIGCHWNSQQRFLYIFPIPMFGFILKFIGATYNVHRDGMDGVVKMYHDSWDIRWADGTKQSGSDVGEAYRYVVPGVPVQRHRREL